MLCLWIYPIPRYVQRPGLSDALDLSQPQDLSDVPGSIMMPLDLSTFPGSAQGIYMPVLPPPQNLSKAQICPLSRICLMSQICPMSQDLPKVQEYL